MRCIKRRDFQLSEKDVGSSSVKSSFQFPWKLQNKKKTLQIHSVAFLGIDAPLSNQLSIYNFILKKGYSGLFLTTFLAFLISILIYTFYFDHISHRFLQRKQKINKICQQGIDGLPGSTLRTRGRAGRASANGRGCGQRKTRQPKWPWCMWLHRIHYVLSPSSWSEGSKYN